MYYSDSNKGHKWVGPNEYNTAYGNGGDDKLYGGDQGAALFGGDGADKLVGGAGDDVLNTEGNETAPANDPTAIDHAYGGAGADVITLGYGDTADGGTDGRDWYGRDVGDTVNVDASLYTSGVTIDLSGLAAGHAVANGAGSILNFEMIGTVTGSAFNDVITLGDRDVTGYGTWTTVERDDYAAGGAGDDVLTGGASTDHLDGGDGRDTLYGMAGDDYLSGGASKDQLHGGNGIDVVDGGTGDDKLWGDAGDDLLRGGDGKDQLFGGVGDDILIVDDATHQAGNLVHGDAGDDQITFTLGDTVDGGAGTDSFALDFSDLTKGQAVDLTGLSSGTTVLVEGGKLSGLESYEAITGGAGADIITLGDLTEGGWAGVHGGQGDDQLTGGIGANHLYGDDGNDTLHGLGGDDVLQGGAGDDLLDGGDNNDTLIADGGHDTLYGGTGKDTLSHTSGGATAYLNGGTNNDVINALWGDTVEGSTGTDTLNISQDYGNPPGAIAIDFGARTPKAMGAHITGMDLYGTISLSNGADTVSMGAMSATADGQGLLGLGGNDHLTGGGGHDLIDGGTGDDTIDGGAGADNLTAGDGRDTVTGGDGNDVVAGGAGNDTLHGGAGDDWIDGGSGNDDIEGDDGIDTASFLQAAGSISVDLEKTGWYQTGEGKDHLQGIENLTGGTQGGDTLKGTDGDNVFYVGIAYGGDVIDGRGGQDTISFANVPTWTGGAYFYGGVAFDLTAAEHGSGVAAIGGPITVWNVENIEGSAAADTLTGDKHDNVVVGGDGDDVIDGGKGNDTISGGLGNDDLTGGSGEDTIDGGDGNDVIRWATLGDGKGDHISGGAGEDQLIVASSAGTIDLRTILGTDLEVIRAADATVTMNLDQVEALHELTAAGLTVATGGTIDLSHIGTISIDTLNLSDAGNTIDLSKSYSQYWDTIDSLTINGGKGDDTIVGRNDNTESHISGGGGNDHLTGSAFDDYLDGGTGNDVLSGGDGYDTYVLDSTKDKIVGEEAYSDNKAIVSFDYTVPNYISDVVLTQAGTVTCGGFGVTVTGSSGDDHLVGGSGGDHLYGGAGNDVLTSGPDSLGDDYLSGGAGDDVVYQNSLNGSVSGGDGYDILYVSTNYMSGDFEETHLVGQATITAISGIGYANQTLASTLTGMNSNDTLIGGSAADTLCGGAGDDVLTGNAGGDHFAFDVFSTTEVDEITDYSAAQGDVLDFKDLEAQAQAAGITQIDYLGTGAFTGHAGEARTELHTGYGLFMFDLDGDKVSDLTIKLDGVTGASTINYVI